METRKYPLTMEDPAIIERLARIVASMRAAKPDYTHLAQELEQAVPFDILGVILLRYDRQAVRVVACHQEAGQWVATYHQHPFDGSKLQLVCRTASTELILKEHPEGLDGLPESNGDALSQYPRLHSTLIAPLIVEGSVLGTLELGSFDPHTYEDRNLQRMVSAVAHVLAAAIEGAQSGGSAEIQNRQRKALKVVSSSLTSKIDLPTILYQIVNGIAQSLNVASAIFMYHRRTEKLTLAAQVGLDSTMLKQLINDSLPLQDTCIISQTVRRRQPHVTQNIVADDRFPHSSALFGALGMSSIFSHPLFTDTVVYGALLLCSAEPGGFTPLKTDILSLFASQATIAIRNGTLLDAAEPRNHFRRLIEEVASQDPPGEEEELALLRQVREATEQTFNLRFVDLLRFMSDRLLTRSELDLQDTLYEQRDEPMLDLLEPVMPEDGTVSVSTGEGMVMRERKDSFVDTLAVLRQTAESALVHAGRLGEISRLIEQLKQTADCVTDGWFIMDLNGMCTYMNPAAAAFCSMRLEEMDLLYGPRLLNLLQDQHGEFPIAQVLDKLWPYIRNADEVRQYLQSFGHDWTYQQEVRCILMVDAPNSKPELNEYMPTSIDSGMYDRHYQFTRYPLYNAQDQLDANALQVREVTQQVRDENNMSMLLSSVSHDLRTPLTTIKGAASGLLQAGMVWDEQERQEMLEDIDREADHLTVLVNALVELSRIKMGALLLEKEWCDILEIVNRALEKVERIAGERQINIKVASKLPLIFVDPVQMDRVLYNLMENAVRRSPDPSMIDVMLDVVDEDGERLRVRVIDQGSEVPEQEHEHIFLSYYRLRSYGNGLGLAICKGIVEAHHGRIWVEAVKENQAVSIGTCFGFSLPVHLHAHWPGAETSPWLSYEGNSATH